MALSLDRSSSLRTLSARDRRILLIGGVIAAILFVLAVILPLDHSVARLREQVARKQADLVWMRSAASEIAAAGPVQSNGSGESLVVWLARLSQQNGVQIESATIDTTGQPGTVNASLVLKSP